MKSISTQANRKPWVTGDIHRLLQARDNVFRAMDESGLRSARANLSGDIKKAKQDYKHKITELWKRHLTAKKPELFLSTSKKKKILTLEKPLCRRTTRLYLCATSAKRTLSIINTQKASGLALTPMIMKWFEQLVLSHIKSPPPSLTWGCAQKMQTPIREIP